ncbi:YceI family protein [Rhodoblastus sp.]|uniref:YceI family protein n=1 Tax=Rhodoblastus sp. TaxID=1962975 RepID=UPI003F955244
MKRAFVALALLAETSAAQAADWKILPDSALTFSGEQAGEKFTGRFSRFDAKISLDPQKLGEAKIVVTLDVASAATGDKQRDTALPDKDWFDQKTFPQARFESRRVTRTATGYEAVGDLTLRGASKQIHLPFTLAIDGRKAEVKGHADLRRDAFGVGQGQWASDEWVAFDVGVDFDLKAEQAD